MAQTVAPRPRTSPPDPNGLPLTPTPRRRRRWSLALVGTLVTVGCALAFAVLWMNAGDRQPVLAVAKRVTAGQVIDRDDLRVVRVSADPGLKPVPGDRLDEFVGLVAATNLVPGTLLTTEHVNKEKVLQRGTAVVGVALHPGQFPSSLQAGDRVQIVRTVQPGTESESLSLGAVLDEGRVLDDPEGSVTGDNVVVSLVVDEDVAAEVAGAANAELLSLVLLPAS